MVKIGPQNKIFPFGGGADPPGGEVGLKSCMESQKVPPCQVWFRLVNIPNLVKIGPRNEIFPFGGGADPPGEGVEVKS